MAVADMNGITNGIDWDVTKAGTGLGIEMTNPLGERISLFVDMFRGKVQIIEDKIDSDEVKRIIPIEWQKGKE